MDIKKCKIIKNVFTSILPFALILTIMTPVNIAKAALPTTVNVLPESSDTSLTAITNGQSRNYATGTAHKDSTGKAGAGRGTISYSTASGSGVLTLDGVDITTTNGLIAASGGTGDLEIVLKGTNSITSNTNTILATSNNIKFSGDGTLTISQNTAGKAISTATAGNIDFASASDITLNQAATQSAIDSVNDLTLTSGTVNVNQTGAANAVVVGRNSNINNGVLNINQDTANDAFNGTGTFNMTNGSIMTKNNGATGNGLNITGAIDITGGMVDSSIINNASTGLPIYGGNTITIGSANIKAIGAAGTSLYGISNATGNAITINKGSVIEAVGNTNGIKPENLVIDDTVTWAAVVGQTADVATRLDAISGTDIANALRNGGQDYVKLYNEITLDPTSSVFDKYTASKDHTEITVALNLNGNGLTEIVTNGTPLKIGTDYILNYNGTDLVSVTFQVREYLQNQDLGTHILTFRFNNGTTADFTLNVVDSSLNTKDDLPKTGDTTSIMPYILLLTAGIFTIIIAVRKKIFE